MIKKSLTFVAVVAALMCCASADAAGAHHGREVKLSAPLKPISGSKPQQSGAVVPSSVPLKRRRTPQQAVAAGERLTPKVRRLGADPIIIHDFQGVDFYGPVYIGTPAQKFEVIYDSGSSNLWVPAATCGLSCMFHARFNENASSTFVANSSAFNILYGSGPCSGYMGQDTVTVGDVSVQGQLFAEITDASGLGESYADAPWDGILGLAWPSISVNGVQPVFFNMIAQNPSLRPEFAFYLQESSSSNGQLDFGGANPAHYKGTLVDVPLTSETYWRAQFESVSLGGVRMHGTGSFIVDSGTSLLTGPSSVIADIANAVNATSLGQGAGYILNCSAADSLPELTLDIRRGAKFVLTGKDYTINAGQGQCMLGLMGMDMPAPVGPLWIFGDVFMRKVYTVFNAQEAKLSMAYSRA